MAKAAKQLKWVMAVVCFWGLSVAGRAATDPVPAKPVPALEDAPSAILERMSEFASSAGAAPEAPAVGRHELRDEKFHAEALRNTQCEDGVLHGKPCRVSWIRVIGSSFIMLAAQHGGNIWMDDDTRNALLHPQFGGFWADYEYCVEHYRWSRWKDDDPFGVDYIGHPMMGALTSSIYEQNDPKQRALQFENTPRYWKGRLKAMAYSAAYSAQWKIGPASEASIGNTGIGYYVRDRDGVYTNETGMQDWFITPIGGFVWNVGEDLIDRYLTSHIRHAHGTDKLKDKLILGASGLMTPLKSAANVSRFRPFYYRDPDVKTEAGLKLMEHE